MTTPPFLPFSPYSVHGADQLRSNAMAHSTDTPTDIIVTSASFAGKIAHRVRQLWQRPIAPVKIELVVNGRRRLIGVPAGNFAVRVFDSTGVLATVTGQVQPAGAIDVSCEQPAPIPVPAFQ
jgi:hypothetical protein